MRSVIAGSICGTINNATTTPRQEANQLTLNIVLLTKVIVTLVVEKFSTFYGNRFFFTVFKRVSILAKLTEPIVGRDRAVGIASRYGLDGSGIESRWGTRFSAPVQTGPGTRPASYAMGTRYFPGTKRPERGVDHPPHLAPRLKKEYSYTSTPPLGLRGLF